MDHNPEPRKTRIQTENEARILDAALDAFSLHGFRGATVDQIVELKGKVLDTESYDVMVALEFDGAKLDPVPFNPATSRLFNMVSFVVELPLRIDRLCDEETRKNFSHLGHLVLVTLEFQVFDEETAQTNRHGEANHDAYKTRQLSVVAQRLWGRPAPPVRPVLEDFED